MERVATIAGRPVRYLETGEGSPVVFVHAFPLGADMWRPQLEAVPDGWRFIAPDLQGFGGSARIAGAGAGATSVDDHADDLLALARALGLDRFVLAGLSMGGYVAMAVARRAPERIRGLMLCDTRAEADTDQARANRVAMRARLVDGGPPAVAADMLPKLLGETTARTQPELIETVRGLIELNGAPGIDDAIVALMTRPDSTATLAGLGCPALILAGDEDVLTPVALHERMHELIPGSTLEIIPGAGHLSNLERPDAFNARLARFLARVERDV